MTEPKTDERPSEGQAEERFVLYAQPIIELASATVSQHEVLLRLHEGGHYVGPESFLAAAVRFGTVREIDRMVVSDTISILEQGGAETLDVNLSGASFGDEELLQLIKRNLERSGVDPSRLVIEVTETAAVNDMGAAIAFAEELHDLGCKLALDDFGVGFGSLYYLKHLPLDYLKIDGEFVRDLTSSERDQAMVRGIAAIARELGLCTIAEFVSDDETVEMLREFGIERGQGFHLGEPALLPDLRRDRSGTRSNRGSKQTRSDRGSKRR